MLPVFAFGSKLVYMFLFSCTALPWESGVCPCPAVGPVFLPSWAQELFVLVPNGEQVPKRREQQS